MSKRPVVAVEVAQDAWQGRAQLGRAGGPWRPLELTVEKPGGQEWRLEGREESPNLTHMSKKRNTVIITHIIHQHRKSTEVEKVHFKTGQQPS